MDPRDAANATPLHLAATVGSVPCVRALIAYGASAAATDSTGATARQLAALGGHHAAELYLLAVESTAAASPGHPTRAELLAGEDQQLDAIFRLACSAQDEVRRAGGLWSGMLQGRPGLLVLWSPAAALAPEEWPPARCNRAASTATRSWVVLLL